MFVVMAGADCAPVGGGGVGIGAPERRGEKEVDGKDKKSGEGRG